MGFLDKVKELFGQAADKVKDPDQNLVEKTWPAGEPDDEHVPQDGQSLPGVDEQLPESMDGEGQSPVPEQVDPVLGVDPELDSDPQLENGPEFSADSEDDAPEDFQR